MQNVKCKMLGAKQNASCRVKDVCVIADVVTEARMWGRASALQIGTREQA
jgi:hypothetical protein